MHPADRNPPSPYPTKAKPPEPAKVFLVVDKGIDGREPDRILSIWPKKEEANRQTLGNGYVSVREAWALVQADGSVYLLRDKAPLPMGVSLDEAKVNRRKAALAKLAKLDAADRAALGLDDE